MISTRYKSILLFCCALVVPAFAQALPDPAAEYVALKQNCGSNADCFTDPAAMLDWVWNTRDPSESAPLTVDIGPGLWIWPGTTCDSGNGNVAFRGAGRKNTVLTSLSFFLGVVHVQGCQNLTFQDLTVRSRNRSGVTQGPLGIGVTWFGGGNSTWTNVSIEATYAAWYEAVDTSGGACGQGNGGVHKWFSSTLHTLPWSGSAWGYLSGCGESWFWGSEIMTEVTGSDAFSSVNGFRVHGPGNSVNLYGTDVRVIARSTAGTSTEHIGLNAFDSGVIHIHGGEVVVRHESTTVNQTVIGAKSSGAGSFVHTLETSFGILPAGTGVARRVEAISSGKVDSAFQWVPGTSAPTPGDTTGVKHIDSINGQDTFIETDCPISTGCQTAGSYPHPMIYTKTCTGVGATKGPWYDTVTNKCRGL